METYEVAPLNDGVDMRGNWKATGPEKRTTHVKKSAAINAARKRASDGDTLIVKGTNGQILEGYPRTIRNASGSSTSDSDGSWTAKEWAKRTSDDMLGL